MQIYYKNSIIYQKEVVYLNIFEAGGNLRLLGVSFRKVTDNWLLYKKHKIKESTYLNYSYIINTYLYKKFKKKRLSFFLNYDMNEFIDGLEKNLSSKTIRDIVLVLKSILKFAERKYNTNFKLDLITMPTSHKSELQVFNEKEIKKIERECIHSQDIRTIGILISVYTGMRIGEICALKWEHIDFSKKLINVTQTLQRVYVEKNKTKVIITPPKTKTSERKIPIPKILYDKLKCESIKYKKTAYILTGEEDKYIEPRSFQYVYKRVIKACEIKYRNFHCLRHTFATRCIRVGMDIKSLSEVLGHADVNITLNRYVHSSYDCKKKFMEKL